MYRALYRKYRPQRFEDVIGQEAITLALENQIKHDKIGHAYLFTGTRGTGKTTCAKLFAKAVNCEDPQGAEPCGVCGVCTGLEDGSILDVSEIDAASNNGVDDVRGLREETAYRPSRCKYRVYIIDEVHMLSTSAFNALLKILEEPPAHVIFILATTEIHKVPATILSRCQRFDFMRIPPDAIAQRLHYVAGQEGITLSGEAADLIARLADGAMRDANSLLDTCSGAGGEVDEALVRRMAGVVDKTYLFSFSDAIAKKDTQKTLALLAGLREQSIDVRRLADELVHHYRNLLLAMADKTGALLSMVPAGDAQKYLENARIISEPFAIGAVRRLAAAMDRMGRSFDPRIELELALFDLCEDEPAARAAQSTATEKRPDAAAAREPASKAVQAEPAPAPAPPTESKAPPKEEQPKPLAVSPAVIRNDAAGDGIHAFEAWPKVVEQMAGVNRMLYSFMKNSSAFVDGKRVLIQADEMFITHMRETEDANACIKQVIEQVTGQRYSIGPYVPPAQEERPRASAKETLDKWEAMGVEVKYD